MCANQQYPRVPPRLRSIYIPSSLFFVTLCTAGRRGCLANPLVHEAFINYCRRSCMRHGTVAGRYVIMPEHIHLFLRLGRLARISSWVGGLKQCLTLVLRPQGVRDSVWQRGFFDHVMRSAESYSQKWDYVLQNPIRAGLVKRIEDWPYTGELARIEGL